MSKRRIAAAAFDLHSKQTPTAAEAADAMLPSKPAQMMKSSDGKSLLFKQYKLTPVGLEVHGTITIDDWKAGGEFLRDAGSALQWWIGDWILLVPTTWGEMYDEAVTITGYTEEYLRNIVSVTDRVKLSFRNDKLSFSHHAAVAAMNRADQKMWLTRAEEGRWSVSKLRKEIFGKPSDKVPPIFRSYSRKFRRTLDFVVKGQIDHIKIADIDPLIDWLQDIKRQKESAENSEENQS